jgi:hypothetical protein
MLKRPSARVIGGRRELGIDLEGDIRAAGKRKGTLLRNTTYGKFGIFRNRQLTTARSSFVHCKFSAQ